MADREKKNRKLKGCNKAKGFSFEDSEFRVEG